MKWTSDQQAAITARGSHVLVSAAAGSGKTAVLVERLAKRLLDEDDPLTADRMLVVTFTNAAAAEMKRRIANVMESAIQQEPDRPYLRKQRQLLNRALITTIHSFCLEVIRENYYLLDLDPAFKIAEERDLVLLQEDVLAEVLEQAYEEASPDFFALVDAYSSHRGDTEIEQLILGLYAFARTLPTPERYLDDLVALYTFGDDPDEEAVLQEFATQLWEDITSSASRLFKIAERMVQAGYVNQGEPLLELTRPLVQRTEVPRWSELETFARTFEFPRAKAVPKSELYYHETLKEAADKEKKKLQTLFKQAGVSGADYLQTLRNQAPYVSELVRMTRAFGVAYERAKRERAFVDFSDLEHFALAVLREGDGPSDVAELYRERFIEVLVDEYQDTNEIQEAIIRLVSLSDEANGNLFMVGDVKQSIVRP